MTRVYGGPGVMSEIAGWRHFLYGAGDGVAEELAANLRNWYPGIQVVGTHMPSFRDLTDEDVRQTVAMINETHPDIVWVGLDTEAGECGEQIKGTSRCARPNWGGGRLRHARRARKTGPAVDAPFWPRVGLPGYLSSANDSGGAASSRFRPSCYKA